LKAKVRSFRLCSEVEQESDNRECGNIKDTDFKNHIEKLKDKALDQKNCSSQRHHDKCGYTPCFKLLFACRHRNSFKKIKRESNFERLLSLASATLMGCLDRFRRVEFCEWLWVVCRCPVLSWLCLWGWTCAVKARQEWVHPWRFEGLWRPLCEPSRNGSA